VGKQISAINLLLPISSCAECRKVRQELSATNGCYLWENSNPSLVSMTDQSGRSLDGGPQGSGTQGSQKCIDRVFLEPRTMRETKTLTWITARDRDSGQVLRCQAKVGAVDRLGILTHYRQFSVNENQHLQVAGFDDEDNIFSSLDGLRFDWTVTSGTDVVKRLAMPDTGSRTAHRSDLFFLKGVQAGMAEVSVRILEPGYEQVGEVAIRLTVVDPFVLLPPRPAYILPTSPYQFSLAHLRMEDDGIQHASIRLPDDQYEWSVEEPIIGSVGADGKFCSRVTEGPTGIEVKDVAMRNNTAEGSIIVVYPWRLEVKLRDVTKKYVEVLADPTTQDEELSFAESLLDPSQLEEDAEETHILIEEHYYLIEMFLYEKGGNLITLTENLQFTSLNLDERYFETVRTNALGSELVFKTKTIAEEI
jgi:nuclear pore complex protein Nup210